MAEAESKAAEAAAPDGAWQHGVLGCFKDCKMCLVTWVAPCYVAGKNAESVGQDAAWHTASFMVGGCDVVCAAMIRQKIREKKGIPGSFFGDLMCHFCCGVCALQQEAMEMESFTWDDAMKKSNKVEEQKMDRE